jgi:RNA polymerase sigma factor (sigma-70 family)
MQERDSVAINAIWDRYFDRLAATVRGQMTSNRRSAVDQADVAQSAFYSFFQGVHEGKFPNLDGRDQLWRLLVVIAKRKAIDSLRREHAKRRGGGKVQGGLILEEFAGSEPTPETAATLVDELRHMLDILRAEDAVLTLIATRKCEGSSNREIAAEVSVSVRTIERKLRRIEILWNEDVQRRDAEQS